MLVCEFTLLHTAATAAAFICGTGSADAHAVASATASAFAKAVASASVYCELSGDATGRANAHANAYIKAEKWLTAYADAFALAVQCEHCESFAYSWAYVQKHVFLEAMASADATVRVYCSP